MKKTPGMPGVFFCKKTSYYNNSAEKQSKNF